MKQPKRGEIYFLDFSPSKGREMKGHHPVLVIQNDIGNKVGRLTIVAAITSNLKVAESLLNPTLAEKVNDLSGVFNDWIVVERHFFNCVAGRSPAIGENSLLDCDLAPSASGFLKTINSLGDGEIPVHDDIDDGRRASRLLQESITILILYLLILVFWSHHNKIKSETKLLQEALNAEQKNLELERSLSNTLEKMLSGFIPICAGCKRIRGKNGEWTPIEPFITNKTGAEFSHGLCSECLKKVYGKYLPPEKSNQAK